MMAPFRRQAQGTSMREGMRQAHQQHCCAAPTAAAGSGMHVPHEAGQRVRPFGALKPLTEDERELF